MKFKVGDKVMCLRGCRDNGYNLLDGFEYTISIVNKLAGAYNLEETHGSWCESRFILAKQKHSMNNKKIAIKVGNNQELSRVVQEFLFSKGYFWSMGQNINFSCCDFIHLDYFIKKIMAYGPLESDYIAYDAATQFGEIITLLSEPPKPVIKIKNDVGQEYEADFEKNPGYVTFGCAKISTETFSVLNEVLNTKVAPDSRGVEQIKIGRGLFTPTEIEAIVKHPDFKV